MADGESDSSEFDSESDSSEFSRNFKDLRKEKQHSSKEWLKELPENSRAHFLSNKFTLLRKGKDDILSARMSIDRKKYRIAMDLISEAIQYMTEYNDLYQRPPPSPSPSPSPPPSPSPSPSPSPPSSPSSSAPPS
ncbi:hypothetical protein LR48_Vigan10g252100 [Vigna angularis]|uniref:Uncharacterized protein n=1 Tax=Phaseolus angularis TaxID=3914 RepID=A0A0L9VPG0_PHAAN|nr:hypothetical protein LR48_Vigan10g252100 [Vigna angularis]